MGLPFGLTSQRISETPIDFGKNGGFIRQTGRGRLEAERCRIIEKAIRNATARTQHDVCRAAGVRGRLSATVWREPQPPRVATRESERPEFSNENSGDLPAHVVRQP